MLISWLITLIRNNHESQDHMSADDVLSMHDEIFKLAKSVLSSGELDNAESISDKLQSDQKLTAVRALQQEIGNLPKRPIFYVHYELNYLPNRTRNIMRYLGDFVDHLVKYMASDLLHNKRYLKKSLTNNLKKLKKSLPHNLYEQLTDFNRVTYTPAKHDFSQPKGRNHYFTEREVVLTCFIVSKFRADIIKLSAEAKAYSENKRIEYKAD
jgi:hypothetical protein